ncbi:MAG: alpha/beta hydrolase [Acidimicrobiales bacterium]
MTVEVAGRAELTAGSVTTKLWGNGPPVILMLHDGLGSIAQWRSLPGLIAERTGLGVMAYDRPGHGTSTPVPIESWPTNWMNEQAGLLNELIIQQCSSPPVVIGHSDGGSIAFLQAAADGAEIASVVSLAAHSYVEQKCVDAIEAMDRDPAPIIAGLSRYHTNPEALFAAWSGAWLSEEFRSWDIRSQLARVSAPVLVLQGTADEYATDEMASGTADAIGANASALVISDAGHLLHHTHTEDLAEQISARTSIWLC